MKRDRAIEILQAIIPSFKREWTKNGGNMNDEKWGFLYRDEYYSQERIKGDYKSRITRELPFEIPEDFLEGVTVKSQKTGEVYTSFMRKENRYRKITMNILSFGSPYEHTYGTLEIDGPRWMDEKGYCHCGYLGDVYQDPNYDPRIQGHWKVDLNRIITEEDTGGRSNWDGWEVGDSNPRFVSYSEMIQTACVVALMRVQGPLFLTASPYSSDGKQLLEVDKNGDVMFHPYFFRNIQPQFESLFHE